MHGWQERETETRKDLEVSQERAAEFDAAKQASMPVMQKEATGMKSFETIKFQPVRAYGLFDAEFTTKDEDIIFHFWPYGFHEAQQKGKSVRFSGIFQAKLKEAMKTSFAENRLEVKEDKDMGAFFVRAIGYGAAMSPFVLATDACKNLYKLLGGQG